MLSVTRSRRIRLCKRAQDSCVPAGVVPQPHKYPTGQRRRHLCPMHGHVLLPSSNGTSREQFGLNEPATYSDATFRADVQRALTDHFGASAMRTGSKAFDVHANSYRVDADVTACFDYRFFYNDGSFRTGTALLPQSGLYIPNYPDQHYDNGYAKHQATRERYRKMVRALKNLADDMASAGITTASAPSFLLESLAWNVPNNLFSGESFRADMRAILAHTFNATLTDDCKEWFEVNGHKYLLRASQPWTREQAHAFLSAAWDHVGYN